jgi:hypothetical protein
MILIDLIEWMYDHWGEVTLNTVLLLLLRKFIMAEVHKLLYFNRDEELKWTREHVERLSGEKWNGQQSIYKRAWIRYTERFTFYSRKATLQGNQRRKTKMNFLKNNVSKKLVVAFVTILLASLNTKLGLGMSDETILVIASTAAVYVAGQAHVDAKVAQVTPQNPNEPNQTF